MKALSDPTRWEILRQMAETDELPCAVLESTLPLSKPTISYHTTILTKAGLITARKAGRNFFYSLNRDVVDRLISELSVLAPLRPAAPRPVRQGRSPSPKTAAGDAPLLTW